MKSTNTTVEVYTYNSWSY